MSISVDSLVFSKPRNEFIPMRALATIVTDQTQTEDDFYINCNSIFPVSLGSMTEAEMDGQRARTDWINASASGGSDRSKLLYDIQRAGKVYNFIVAPPAACEIDLPEATAPLLRSWKACGAALYGRDDFTINFVDTLRRDVAPQGPVVGRLIHDDLNFDVAFRTRGFSIVSVVADQPYHDQTLRDPQWATHLLDARGLTLAEHRALKQIQATDHAQQRLRDLCPSRPIMPGQHWLFPSYQLHQAGGIDLPLPRSVSSGDVQPKCYISHFMMSKPLGTPWRPPTY